MKKIEDFEVMESFGMSNVTIDDMFDIDGSCFINTGTECNCNKNSGTDTSNKGHGSGSGNGNGNGNGNKRC